MAKNIQKESDLEFAKRMEALNAKTMRYHNHPWILNQRPFQVTDHIYYVGTTYVATYLIDTGDGLVLIDTCCFENAAQVIHNIHQMGFSPEEVKYIFLSHAHFDHCGAARYLQEFTNETAQIWLGEDDLFFLDERRDLMYHPEWVPEFKVAKTYPYGTSTKIGNVVFHFIHTPGHTPGCTTFLIETSTNGKPLTAAMHGGLAIVGLTYKELDENKLPRSLHQAFYDQFVECRELKVDVTLVSHNHDYDLIGLSQKDDGSHQVFIDPSSWPKLMADKLERYMTIY